VDQKQFAFISFQTRGFKHVEDRPTVLDQKVARNSIRSLAATEYQGRVFSCFNKVLSKIVLLLFINKSLFHFRWFRFGNSGQSIYTRYSFSLNPPSKMSAASIGTGVQPVGDVSSAKAQETQAIQSFRRNASYLIKPDNDHRPARFRTRALLKTMRYVSIFIFWRLVRYAKYALIGSLAAAVAGTAIGSVVSGAGFILAPTGIFAGAGVGLLWGLGKFGWRTLARRARNGNLDKADARQDEQSDAGEDKPVDIKAPRTDPW
jgi:hypothetical protein